MVMALHVQSFCNNQQTSFRFRSTDRFICHGLSRRRLVRPGARRQCIVRAEGADSTALAPAKPRTPLGEMMSYYLSMEPHLFRDALETQFVRLKNEKDEREKQMEEKQKLAESSPTGTDSADLVLYRRMDEVKSNEQRVTVEDLMYVSVLEKFLEVGVNMMPRLENVSENHTTLQALTESIHTEEALDLVKDHMRAVMGPAAIQFADATIRMAKLQAAQVYAASVMFGYFLRRVDKRFQLAKSFGMLPESREDTVARLERLFLQADHPDDAEDLDSASATRPSESGAESQEADTSSAEASSSSQPSTSKEVPKPAKGALKKYIDSFDKQTVIEMARLVSMEGAALVELQTQALFGDLTALQRQMQEAVGQDAVSIEDLMQRVQEAVQAGKVDLLTVTVATQRRAVLEAVAFGTFLRDVEVDVDTKYGILTPARVSLP